MVTAVFSLWGWCSSACFAYSIFATDLILLKIGLIFAYIFLLLQSISNASNAQFVWDTKTWVPPGLDAILVNALILITHCLGIWRFFKDEMDIKLEGEWAEKAWRLFWRRVGCPKLEFHQLMKIAQIKTFSKGEIVLEKDEQSTTMCIVLRGIVEHVSEPLPVGYGSSISKEDQILVEHFSTYSGDVFYLQELTMLGINLGALHTDFTARSFLDNTVIMYLKHSDIEKVTESFGPHIITYLRNYVMYCLGHTISRTHANFVVHQRQNDSREDPENPEWFEGGETNDMSPLRETELPPPAPWTNPIKWVYDNFSWMPPHGLRHGLPPFSATAAMKKQRAQSEKRKKIHQEEITAMMEKRNNQINNVNCDKFISNNNSNNAPVHTFVSSETHDENNCTCHAVKLVLNPISARYRAATHNQQPESPLSPTITVTKHTLTQFNTPLSETGKYPANVRVNNLFHLSTRSSGVLLSPPPPLSPINSAIPRLSPISNGFSVVESSLGEMVHGTTSTRSLGSQELLALSNYGIIAHNPKLDSLESVESVGQTLEMEEGQRAAKYHSSQADNNNDIAADDSSNIPTSLHTHT